MNQFAFLRLSLSLKIYVRSGYVIIFVWIPELGLNVFIIRLCDIFLSDRSLTNSFSFYFFYDFFNSPIWIFSKHPILLFDKLLSLVMFSYAFTVIILFFFLSWCDPILFSLSGLMDLLSLSVENAFFCVVRLLIGC